MREKNHIIEMYRIPGYSDPSMGNCGAFLLKYRGVELRVIASDGDGWDHVSISVEGRCPTWDEMCYVKNLFWDKEELVIQYHPKASEYVNNCEFCLHLWKPQGQEVPRPPVEMVGLKKGYNSSPFRSVARGAFG